MILLPFSVYDTFYDTTRRTYETYYDTLRHILYDRFYDTTSFYFVIHFMIPTPQIKMIHIMILLAANL